MPIGQNVGHRTGRLQSPVLEQDHLIGEEGGEIEIMHHGNDTAAALTELAGERHYGELMADIEAGNRLIEKQPARLAVDSRLRNLA
jgi:hypothetical protein